MKLIIGKYAVTTESFNSLLVLANTILDIIERGIDLAKEMIPEDCTVEEIKEDLKSK